MSSQTPRVESFVLRFVADAPDDGVPPLPPPIAPGLQPAGAAPDHPGPIAARGWHGVVVHVQSNQVKPFTNFADAIAFIARYVPVGDFILQEEDDRPTPSSQT